MLSLAQYKTLTRAATRCMFSTQVYSIRTISLHDTNTQALFDPSLTNLDALQRVGDFLKGKVTLNLFRPKASRPALNNSLRVSGGSHTPLSSKIHCGALEFAALCQIGQ